MTLQPVGPMRSTLFTLLAAMLFLLAAGPAQGTTLLALVDTGELFASDDLGETWSVRSALPVSDSAALIAGSSFSELYLASATGTVYRSSDAGVNWSAAGSVAASDVVDLTGEPGGDLLALTRTGTVYASSDLGATWSGRGAITASNLVSFAVAANSKLYALARTGEVFESNDAGATWTVVGTIPVPDAVDIRRLDTGLVVLSGTGLTYLSSDYGVTWSAVGTVSQVGMAGLTTLAGDLLAVTREGLVARSGDGSAWSWVGAVNQLTVVALANDYPTVTGIPESPLPVGVTLVSPRPNPLVLSGSPLAVDFSLSGADRVTLLLYDISGRRVLERAPEAFPDGGKFTIRWSLDGLSSGIYFLQLVTDRGYRAGARVAVLR